jgi:hypothetical protein
MPEIDSYLSQFYRFAFIWLSVCTSTSLWLLMYMSEPSQHILSTSTIGSPPFRSLNVLYLSRIDTAHVHLIVIISVLYNYSGFTLIGQALEHLYTLLLTATDAPCTLELVITAEISCNFPVCFRGHIQYVANFLSLARLNLQTIIYLIDSVWSP